MLEKLVNSVVDYVKTNSPALRKLNFSVTFPKDIQTLEMKNLDEKREVNYLRGWADCEKNLTGKPSLPPLVESLEYFVMNWEGNDHRVYSTDEKFVELYTNGIKLNSIKRLYTANNIFICWPTDRTWLKVER